MELRRFDRDTTVVTLRDPKEAIALGTSYPQETERFQKLKYLRFGRKVRQLREGVVDAVELYVNDENLERMGDDLCDLTAKRAPALYDGHHFLSTEEACERTVGIARALGESIRTHLGLDSPR